MIEPEEIVVDVGEGKTVVVRRKAVEPITQDPVASCKTIADLQRLIDDSVAHPDLAWRAAERLTSIVADRINGGRQAEKPILSKVVIKGQAIMLDSFEREEIEHIYAASVQAIRTHEDHDKSLGIKCSCLDAFRRWYYQTNERSPNSPVALCSQNLWDVLEAESRERQRPVPESPELRALRALQASLDEQEASNSEFPEWLGARSQKGWENQAKRRAKKVI